MKQFYKIGEISKLYQIGPDSLRYYERLGLLTPTRGENDYRMYGLNDLWRLNVIRDLRRLNFSMETIRQYMEHRSIASTKQLFEDELTAINEQIALLNDLKENVADRLSTLNEATSQPLGTVLPKRFPRRRCHTILQPYRTDEEMDMLMEQLLNKDQKNLYIIGNNRIGSFLPAKEAQEGNCQNYEGVFMIDPKGNSFLEEGTYLSVSYSGNYRQHHIYIPKILEFAKSNQLRLDDTFLELLWVDIHQAADPTEHITELQIRCLE